MSAQIISGKEIAAEIRSELKAEIGSLRERGVTPGLGVILVGDDPASISYVTAKEKACEEIGIRSDDNRLPGDISQDGLYAVIHRLNADPDIHGILLQLPLPGHIDEAGTLTEVDPAKDIDGLHPLNVGNMLTDREGFIPCTPQGVLQLLTRSGVEIEGANVAIVGRSNLVGKPLANLLIRKTAQGNATVTVCHSRSRDIAAHTRGADIVIAAAGRANLITAGMIKPGAVVIDVGVNRVEDSSRETGYRLVGDVDFESVKEKASMITPVPGGVGPMTIAMLLYNTVQSAKCAAEGG